MILHFDPSAPFWMRAAAQAALSLHIAGASTALVAGPAAMIFRKGGRLHQLSGHVFFVAMLTMSGIGAVVAPFLNDPFSAIGGAFAFYLTATGWAAMIRGPGRIGRFEPVALLFILGVGAADLFLGSEAMASPSGALDGQPYQAAFIIAGLCVLAAGSDIAVILRGGVSGVARTTRHLWRMCLALLVTALSFAAQPKAQPEALRGSPIFMIPAALILLGLVYWLVRVRLEGRRQPLAGARPTNRRAPSQLQPRVANTTPA